MAVAMVPHFAPRSAAESITAKVASEIGTGPIGRESGERTQMTAAHRAHITRFLVEVFIRHAS